MYSPPAVLQSGECGQNHPTPPSTLRGLRVLGIVDAHDLTRVRAYAVRKIKMFPLIGERDERSVRSSTEHRPMEPV